MRPTKNADSPVSPRGDARSTKKTSHRDIERLKKQRQTIDLSSVKSAKRVERDDSHIVPASPFSPEKRVTLPTFNEWGDQKEPLKPQGWRTSIQSPRRQSIQPATPRLGAVRQVVGDAIADLLGSMAEATVPEIEDALVKLGRIEGSHQNLGAVIQELLQKAAAARSKSQGLEKQAADMEAQAATLQKVNEGGTPRRQETMAALRAELARRASRQAQDADAEPVEYGSVEEAESRAFGEETFRTASFSLNRVLAQLEDWAPTPEPGLGKQKPHVDDKKHIASRPLGGTAGIRGTQSSKAEAKLAAHSAKYQQLRALAKEEKESVRKWQAALARQQEGSEKPTGSVLSMDSVSNL